MWYPLGFVFSLLVLVGVGCGDASEGGSLAQWVTGAEAERVCEAWCDPELTCRPLGASDEQCLGSCRYHLAGPCGRHWATTYDCRVELDCPDDFGDCETPLTGSPFGLSDCAEQLNDACESCPPGTARHDECFQVEPVCGYDDCGYRREACFVSGGDCNADYVTALCERRNRQGIEDCSGISEF